MQVTAAFWDRMSRRYAKSKIGDMDAYEYTLGRSRSYMKESDQVLELGCGTGMTALRLADAVAHFTASDYSAGMIEQCQLRAEEAKLDNVSFQQAGVTDPKLQTGSYDIVMAHSLLHLLPDLPGALRSVDKMLKPGGIFISKTVCIGETGLLARALFKTVLPLMQLIGKAPYVRFLTVAELEKAIVDAGFQIVESGNHPDKTPPARYLVARKY